jgi:hypothetical protein
VSSANKKKFNSQESVLKAVDLVKLRKTFNQVKDEYKGNDLIVAFFYLKVNTIGR